MQMKAFANRLVDFNNMYKLPVSISPVLSWAQASSNAKVYEGHTPGEIPDGNQTYEHWNSQINNFVKIMREELEEADDIVGLFEDYADEDPQDQGSEEDEDRVDEFDILTAIADWLGDIVVYCMSEATKYGVADQIAEVIYCDHSAHGVIYEEMDTVEAAISSVAEGLNATFKFHARTAQEQISSTAMANMLNAIISRCFHEAEHFGFDLYEVLEIIMDSNMSKLGADGLPIYDERGKVMKGPNYWKPEPKIREYIESLFLVDGEEDEVLEDEEEIVETEDDDILSEEDN